MMMIIIVIKYKVTYKVMLHILNYSSQPWNSPSKGQYHPFAGEENGQIYKSIPIATHSLHHLHLDFSVK